MTARDRFDRWIALLEARHLETLTPREVARAVRSISTTYVERRERLPGGNVLASAGKRAAFALFYAPLHWLAVYEIVRALGAADHTIETLVDLGCGTGAAGAAWAASFARPPRLLAFDKSGWAVDEAAWTYRAMGLAGSARRADLSRVRLPGRRLGLIAAFTVNELDEGARSELLEALLDQASKGAPVLVVEPIARKLTPWWDEWRDRVLNAGGRVDEWRFAVELPERLRVIGRSAGLDQREITAKSFFLDGTRR